MDFRIPIQKFLYEISHLKPVSPSFPRSPCSYKNSAEHDGGSRICIGFLYEPDRISDKTLTACLLTHNYIGCCIPKHSPAWYPATSSERRDLTSINSYLAHTYTIDRLSATITHTRAAILTSRETASTHRLPSLLPLQHTSRGMQSS